MRTFLILLLYCTTFIANAQSTFVPPKKYMCVYTDECTIIGGQANDKVQNGLRHL